MWMFWICLLGVITSGLQVLAVFKPCRCFGKISVYTSFCVQIGSIVMLIIGSVWRFSQSGRACATNLGTAKASLIEDAIGTGAKTVADATNTFVEAKIKEMKEQAGLKNEEEKKKAAEAIKEYIWVDTATAMKVFLISQYVTMSILCLMCICTCGAVTPKVNFWHSGG